MGDRLIFQLGTNNWQRDGEFAPGSGILHESHHHAYNALPGVRCYSMYPSRRQRFAEEDVHVFPLEHDIPICESVSPVSSYRWHAMSEDEVDAYRLRLTNAVADWMDEIEARTGDRFSLAIAHHALHEHRGAARRQPAPGRGRQAADAGAVLRARHRAEDVQQRAHAATTRSSSRCGSGRSCSARRSSTSPTRSTVSTWSRRSRPSRSTRSSTCSRSSRASGSCSRPTATTRTSSARCPTAPTGRRCWPASSPSRSTGSGLEPEAGRAAGRVRRRRRVLRQVRRLEAAGRAAARGGDLRAATTAGSSPW